MKRRLPLRLLLCLAFGLGQLPAGTSALAQAPTDVTESALKAAFLFKFAAFIDWPAGTFQRPDQPLVIGVSGDDPVALDLEHLVAGRSVAGRPLVARRVAENGPFTDLHVLFLGNRRDHKLREALAAVPGPVLVVTEQPEALRLGSVLNFSSEDGRVRFSASLTSAEARNLKLSSRLLAVAQLVEGRNR
jgi:hypothetical protein